ncbi:MULTISPECIES: hypothetical protein [Leptospira]|uniref:Uncharacterized protein n=2 Tax=Leptospira TaxID=171 RepID=A0A0E2B609_9LEPT|nr:MULTISPECIES: hypothetical protein [Leptospira]EKO16285.1 hypothetical protein LEP1GSC081_0344 [Leptospira kirschneri str. H1]EKO23133.1 hypothetical protein LEP1GSC104_3898 [Leptospira interrogans str. UI 12621]EMN82228.1 hypothetical protein LEP1GSC106_0590 [Leptospira interrogans serovar Grippotyphosa str. UI 12764]MBM2890529.1 hypothetical protein [Leptospira interrogans]
MNPADFKKTVLEIRKLAKKYTRDKSKKQFDYELFEYPFLEYVKKKEINLATLYQVAYHFIKSNDDFDKDMAIFIIKVEVFTEEIISKFLQECLLYTNKEQINSVITLVETRNLKDLYYPLVNHLKFNSFYNSESFRKRLTYTGILFDKEEGYKEFQEALERDLLSIDSKVSYVGSVLSSLQMNKNYEQIHKIFLRYGIKEVKYYMRQQLSAAAERWNIGRKERLMIQKTIIAACIKNFFKLNGPEPRKN